MANPNIKNLETFTYENGGYAITNTTATAIPVVTAETVMVVDSLLISNIDGTNDATVTITQVQDGGSYNLATSMNIAAGTSVQLAERPFVFKETEYATASASANGDLVMTWHGRILNDA